MHPSWTYLPIFHVLHDHPFTRQHRFLTPVRVPIALGQKERNKVDAGPNLFPLQFPRRKIYRQGPI